LAKLHAGLNVKASKRLLIQRRQVPFSFLLRFIAENSSPGHLIFFLIPVGIQISVNVVLFILTIVYYKRAKAKMIQKQEKSRLFDNKAE